MTRSLSAERCPYRHVVSEDTHGLVIFLQTTRSEQSHIKGGVSVEDEAEEMEILQPTS